MFWQDFHIFKCTAVAGISLMVHLDQRNNFFSTNTGRNHQNGGGRRQGSHHTPLMYSYTYQNLALECFSDFFEIISSLRTVAIQIKIFFNLKEKNKKISLKVSGNTSIVDVHIYLFRHFYYFLFFQC